MPRETHHGGRISSAFGKICVFGSISGALEINSVTIRILQRRYPHTISDKGPRRLDASRFGITINCEGIVADEADSYTFTDLSLRHPRIVPFGSEFLQHERYVS